MANIVSKRVESVHEGPTPLGPRFARFAVGAAYAAFCLSGLPDVLRVATGPVDVIVALVGVIAIVGLQVSYVSRRQPMTPRLVRYGRLLLQAVLALVPALFAQPAWPPAPGFLAGSALLTMPAMAGWVTFGLTVVVVALLRYGAGDGFGSIVYATASTVVVGLLVYGLARLAASVVELHSARMETAGAAISQERRRFARDLHDLLGYSISAITLKSELTQRLLTKNPVRAKEEIAGIVDICRQALADVRAVASGDQVRSLEEEASSAHAVLTVANVHTRVQLSYHDVPTDTLSVLATILREGVTNVLRHSAAENCEISIEQRAGRIDLEILNDGLVPVSPNGNGSGPPDASGNGIGNLATRVRDLHGTMAAGTRDGKFRLHVTIPLDPARPDPAEFETRT